MPTVYSTCPVYQTDRPKARVRLVGQWIKLVSHRLVVLALEAMAFGFFNGP